MYYLVVLIVNEIEQVPDVLARWEELGATGTTILESIGYGKLKRAGLLENLPLLVSVECLEALREIHHRTLLSVVDSEELVEKMIATAQEVMGDLEQAHSGFLFVVPVLKAIGIGKG